MKTETEELMDDGMAVDLWLTSLNDEINDELAENGKSDVSDLLAQRYSILKRVAAHVEQASAPAAVTDERAAFEAAWIDIGGMRMEDYDLSQSVTGKSYRDDEVQAAWEIWQARALLSASAKEAPAVVDGELTVADYEEVLADHRRLVRELDVLLNGDGAAKQASLCDIVAQLRRSPIVAKSCTKDPNCCPENEGYGCDCAYGQECTSRAGDGQAVMELKQVYEAFGIGEQARTMPTLLMNIENARRRSECLWSIEREFFTKEVPVEDSLADEPGDTHEECLLMWGAGREEYVEQFRAALAELTAAPAAVPEGWKMVPVEPNDAMQAAGPGAIRFDTTVLNKMWTANAVYRAMIAAAPTPPAAQAVEADARTREQWIALKEGALIHMSDRYFEARPELNTVDGRRLFEAAFVRGFDAAIASQAKEKP